LSVALFALIATGVMVAGFVQGTTGVGFALIVAPILALLAPDLVPVSLLMLMIPLNVYVAWREWEALDRSGATWITVGRFLGTFGGLWLLTTLTSSLLNVLIGAVTILAAIATLIAPSFTPNGRALSRPVIDNFFRRGRERSFDYAIEGTKPQPSRRRLCPGAGKMIDCGNGSMGRPIVEASSE
jgi:uncharacterized membrane protein YfcA